MNIALLSIFNLIFCIKLYRCERKEGRETILNEVVMNNGSDVINNCESNTLVGNKFPLFRFPLR